MGLENAIAGQPQVKLRVRRDGRLAVFALLLCAAGLVAGAALLGYWQHRLGSDAGQRDGSSSSDNADSGRAPVGGPSAFVEREKIIDERIDRPSKMAASNLEWPLWEFQLRQPIPPREPPLTPPSWRLIGATSSGGKRSLIILRQGKTAPEFYRTGDTLPGGYVVGEITDEDVTLSHGKRAVLLSYIGTR